MDGIIDLLKMGIAVAKVFKSNFKMGAWGGGTIKTDKKNPLRKSQECSYWKDSESSER